jgi:capsular exopolysaccharide synthesis family protein
MFSGKAGMMRLPETVESGRKVQAPQARTPKSARASWSPPPSDSDDAPTIAMNSQSKALVKGQMISLTDTAISAMPSESKDLVVLHDRDGPFAAELRILATRMEDLKNRLGYRSFLVTSVGEGDGKTVAASNLALAMSEDSERRVALVDANFRNPRAADLFNLDKRRSLLAALNGEYPLSQCVARVLGRNLIVLHAGGTHDNPAAILSSPKFKSLLAELYQAVDFMIVDAPQAIPFADVPLLTQHVDAVLMVGAAHMTDRAALDEALETIGRARVVGSVFMNRKKAKRAKKNGA